MTLLLDIILRFTCWFKRSGERGSLPREAGLVIVWALLLLAACATSVDQATSGYGEPRPIGVPENASPDEKGREILRVVLALVKHGDLRDTEFASRLLRLTITPRVGLLASPKQPFPQQLVQSFSYIFNDVGMPHQAIRFDLSSSEVCLRFDDFLTAFNKKFGIGTEIFKDNRSPPPQRVLPEQGWREMNHIHLTRTRDIYQSMPTGLGVSAVFIPAGCAASIKVEQYKSFKS